ncbi:MAG: GDSL-type esterase/lipase family protein [Bdellovibrionota bacterium]
MLNKKSFFKLFLLLCPLCLLLLDLPINSSAKLRYPQVYLILCLYLLITVRWFGQLAGRSLQKVLPIYLPCLGLVGITIYLAYRATSLPIQTLSYLIIITVLFTLSWGMLSVLKFRATGIFSLVIFCGLLVILESYLQIIPKSVFASGVVNIEPLVPDVDRGIEAYRKNGFRGKRPCKDCPKDNIRIFTIGGSSTYGIPLYYDVHTYSSVLQRMLDEKRPGENYEVLNAGIAGYGITQVYDSIKNELLQYKPDIVIINAWFNDSAAGMNWYGMQGKSDIEAFKLTLFMRWLQNFPPYKIVHYSRLFNLYKYYLLKIQPHFISESKVKRKSSPRIRMKSGEFESVLHDIMHLSQEAGFLPMLVFEPLNRTRVLNKEVNSNKYYKVLEATAKKFDVPLIDPLTAISQRGDDWLFYDFIHPNKLGHEEVAKAIYKTFYDQSLQTDKSRIFWETKKIQPGLPDVNAEKVFVIDKTELDSRIIKVTAAIPYAAARQGKLELSLEGKSIASKPGLTSVARDFTFKIPSDYQLLPLNKISFKARFETSGIPKFLIGGTEAYSPVQIVVKSGGKDYGWQSQIDVQGFSISPNQRGYNLVVLSGRTGDVLAIELFDIFNTASENKRLENFFNSLGVSEEVCPRLLSFLLRQMEFYNANKSLLTKTFQIIGASGDLPNV